MILRAAETDTPSDRELQGALDVAFAALWATGPDVRRDRVFRIQALRRVGGTAQVFDTLCRPFDDAAGGGEATQRMAREYGVAGGELADAPTAEEAWPHLAEFLAGRTVLTTDRAEFEGRSAVLGGAHPRPEHVLGLGEIAEVLCPGRLSGLGENLIAEIVPRSTGARRAVGPRELRAAAGALVGSFLELDPAAIALAVRGYRLASRSLARIEPRAARTLSSILELAAAPRAWADAEDQLFPLHPGLREGVVQSALDRHSDLAGALAVLTPPWTTPENDASPPLPPDLPDPRPLDPDDERRLDEAFRHHLPLLFGGSYRRGQHEVAKAVAQSLGAGELLLVHAPTGTGKTLAYLVPAAMWAARNGVRLCVATFTRALQEQAMDREVPLALELLRRSGFPHPPRIAVLKGRQNYLCWRALELMAPLDLDAGSSSYAWTRAALFALTDAVGDLDRLPRRSELFFEDARDSERELTRLLRRTRAESGCCRERRDRSTCAAEAARRRAERSHVVITNHALALSRKNFFRYAVFDECEHLHDQAHAAWSHVLPIARARELLHALLDSNRDPRGPLERVLSAALGESEAHGSAARCSELHAASLDALGHLEQSVQAFKAWRASIGAEREEKDAHSLFREYAASERGESLLEAHALLAAAWNELTVELAALSEHLEQVAVRGKPRLRRALDLARTDLEEALLGITAWIPRDENGAAFRPETFYDVETDARGRDALAARVLLPHEYLGRYYFPELRAGVCISATTYLGGGFETSAAYLGLQRAAHPAPDEAREPTPFRTFHAPAPFDYARVLVAVPRDAPAFHSRSKEAFLEYTRRFVRELGLRTRGRMLVLFTNAADCVACGRELVPFFAERGIPFWYQRMEGTEKEELAELFRSRIDSILFGLDTFWYGADFPGETLEYLVIVKLPYGVPDRYHHAQCAALGVGEQRRSIYMPRALAKFRQGFGRLMRKETDRGCVFVLDGRVLDPRHRAFLREIPLDGVAPRAEDESRARFFRGETERCLHEALAHMGMLADAKKHEALRERAAPAAAEPDAEGPLDLTEEDLPF